jgi:diguanylate cyclase (GGDEF)-like protein
MLESERLQEALMSATTVSRVLEAVADVSAERDVGDLRRSLLQTITEVMDCGGADFWSPLPTDDGKTGPFGIRLDDSARASLDAGRIVSLQSDSGAVVQIYPLAHDEALVVHSRGPEGRPDDTRVAQAMLRLYRNFADLISASEQDRLTGLFNRRSFDAQLSRAAEACLPAALRERRGGAAAVDADCGRWLVMFDVDHFKRINDRFGHLYGDEVLLLLAQLLRRRFRGDDRCFRYGGEEFAVLLAPTDEAGARTAVERLRHDVENHPFPRVGQVTISLGCLQLQAGLSPTDLVDLADRALYEAKRGGRNRAVFAAPPTDRDSAELVRSFGEVELF